MLTITRTVREGCCVAERGNGRRRLPGIAAILRIECLASGRAYDFETRYYIRDSYQEQMRLLRRGRHSSRELQADWHQHGPKSFRASVVSVFAVDD